MSPTKKGRILTLGPRATGQRKRRGQNQSEKKELETKLFRNALLLDWKVGTSAECGNLLQSASAEF